MYLHAYLPDDLGRRAKDAGLNISAVLREALERQLAEEEKATRIETGVYRAGSDVLVQLNAAHRARRNGVELDPPEPLPEPAKGKRTLRVSIDTLRRWLAALES